MGRRQRGRRVPLPLPLEAMAVVLGYDVERLRLAQHYAAKYDRERRAAGATLPQQVTLRDGRWLPSEPWGVGRAYHGSDGMVCIATYDGSPHGLLLHVSCSYPDRLPSWEDLGAIRQAFFAPDQDVIQVLPRSGEYINVHQHTLHLYAAPETWQGGIHV